GDSLVKIQAKERDFEILVEELANIANNFYTRVENITMRKSYSETGLSLQSCEIINGSIELMVDNLGYKLDDNYEILYNNIFECFSQIDEMQPERAILKNLAIWENKDFIMDFVSLWVKGSRVDELKDKWINYSKYYTNESMDVFIEELLYYKIPWGVTAYNIILAFHLNVEMQELPESIRYLPVFMKHGLNDIVACWAKSFGVPTRDSSILLAKAFYGSDGRRDIESFIKWFVNLTYYEIEEIIGNNSHFELNNIISLTQRINSEKFYNKFDQEIYTFYIKGINFVDERINAAYIIDVDDNIKLIRDYSNSYDIYAIKVYFNDKELGFVPRNLAKIFALEMDINRSEYKGRVISKKLIENNYTIEVEIGKTQRKI
ncbi:MAG: HIRAN domain-containing protein, partial [Bacilli bacterium]